MKRLLLLLFAAALAQTRSTLDHNDNSRIIADAWNVLPSVELIENTKNVLDPLPPEKPIVDLPKPTPVAHGVETAMVLDPLPSEKPIDYVPESRRSRVRERKARLRNSFSDIDRYMEALANPEIAFWDQDDSADTDYDSSSDTNHSDNGPKENHSITTEPGYNTSSDIVPPTIEVPTEVKYLQLPYFGEIIACVVIINFILGISCIVLYTIAKKSVNLELDPNVKSTFLGKIVLISHKLEERMFYSKKNKSHVPV